MVYGFIILPEPLMILFALKYLQHLKVYLGMKLTLIVMYLPRWADITCYRVIKYPYVVIFVLKIYDTILISILKFFKLFGMEITVIETQKNLTKTY